MRRSTRWILVAIAAALLLGAAGVAARRWANDVMIDARAGKSEARAGVTSLAAMDATAAATHFSRAKTSFTAVRRSLGPDWVSRPAKSIPWLGKQFAAAESLALVGSDGSTAGIELAEAIREAAPATATASTPDQHAAQLVSRLSHVNAALSALTQASDRAQTLSPDGLVPPLADAVRDLQKSLSAVAPFMKRGRALFKLQSYLSSGARRILVVTQDGAELRPTGGWSGSFGIITVSPTGARLESYQDVFVLPDPPGQVTPPPGAFQTNDFNFRNANWWLDYPTSAKAMLAFWRSYGQPPVDALVIVDTVAMAHLLEVTGPVAAPQHKETFTSKNLLDRLLYLTQVERGGQPDRKNVLVELANELEKRLLGSRPELLAKSATVFAKAADSKHVQMYFTDADAQAAVEALGWSGKVAPPKGTTDMVAVCNAMNKPGKVNVAMKKSITYNVQLQGDGSAQTKLVLGYANTGPYLQYLPPDFRDWLRVYRIPGTIFAGATPAGEQPMTMTEFAFPAEVRSFTVGRGQTKTQSLSAKVPKALQPADAGRDDEAVYRLYMVRQADLEDIPTTVIVTTPPEWRLIGATAWLTASGNPLPVTLEKNGARMAAPLSGDLVLDVRLKRR